MKVLVLGVGRQGSAALWDLMESNDVTNIIAADIDIKKVKSYVNKLKQIDARAEKIEIVKIDVDDKNELKNLLKKVDVVSDCLLWTYTIPVAKMCIEAGVHHVDLWTRDEMYTLDKVAKDAGVTIVPNCGLDPGINNVIMGYGASKLDKVERILEYCGGIPQKGTPIYNTPLHYGLTWSFAGVIEELTMRATIVKDGKEVELSVMDKLSNPEMVTFPEPIGQAEAWYGMPYDKKLFERLGLKDVKEAWKKTVRWPGWCEAWKLLINLNLLSEEPLRIKGIEITPKEFFTELGEKYLKYNFEAGDRDLIVEKLDIEGIKDDEYLRYSYLLIDFYDEKKGLTAMQRTTAFPNSIVCQMIGRGDIKERGVIDPGLIGWNRKTADIFFTELKKRNIVITESVTKPLL